MKKIVYFITLLTFSLGCTKNSNKMRVMSTKHSLKELIVSKKNYFQTYSKQIRKSINKKKYSKLIKILMYLVLLKNINKIKAQKVNGTFEFSFGGSGTEDGKFTSLQGIDISENKKSLYANDLLNDPSGRVQVFYPNGTFKFKWNYTIPQGSLEFLDIGLYNNISILTNNAASSQILARAFDRFDGTIEYDLIAQVSSLFLYSGIDIYKNRAFIVGSNILPPQVPQINIFNISETGSVLDFNRTLELIENNFFDIKVDDDIGYITLNSQNNSFVIKYDTRSNEFLSNFSVGNDINTVLGIEVINNCILVAANNFTNGFIRVFEKNGTFINDFGNFLEPTYLTGLDNFVYVSDSGNQMISAYKILGNCSEDTTTTSTTSTTSTTTTTTTTTMPITTNATTRFTTTTDFRNFTTSTTQFVPTKKPLPECIDIEWKKDNYDEGDYIEFKKNIEIPNANQKNINLVVGILGFLLLAIVTILIYKLKHITIKKNKNDKKLTQSLLYKS